MGDQGSWYMICHKDDDRLVWNREGYWTSGENFDVYDFKEKESEVLPPDGVWRRVNQ